MGRKIVLTGTQLTDTTAPKLVRVDPMEAAGSLVLIDPTHPAQPWAAGVPAHNTTLPNLFSAQAGSIAGGATVTLQRGGGWNGTTGKLERTGKGALHSITSPTLAIAGAELVNLQVDGAIKTYLLNTTNLIFMSVWERVTQVRSGNMVIGVIGSNSNPSVNRLTYMFLGASQPSGRVAVKALGGQIGNVASNTWVGTKPGAIGSMIVTGWYGGSSPILWSDALTRTASPTVFYRFYIEDLTVSGRTYAQADAIDNALYTKEVLTAGGRYHGDTFTDPATLA